MQSEERLRFVHRILLESWKLFKSHSGEPNTDSKWDAIISEANGILEEAKGDAVAKQIVYGFVGALEAEDKEAMKR